MENKSFLLWTVIILLIIGVAYFAFIKGSATGNVVESVGTAVQSTGMVGGC
ncbi:MAG: hypothetical protein AABX65_04480 [Nanoarchaeota archaeon]